ARAQTARAGRFVRCGPPARTGAAGTWPKHGQNATDARVDAGPIVARRIASILLHATFESA
ncbi:hypothetical protein ACX84Z_34120, partial [Burkholderia pseudomallei]